MKRKAPRTVYADVVTHISTLDGITITRLTVAFYPRLVPIYGFWGI